MYVERGINLCLKCVERGSSMVNRNVTPRAEQCKSRCTEYSSRVPSYEYISKFCYQSYSIWHISHYMYILIDARWEIVSRQVSWETLCIVDCSLCNFLRGVGTCIYTEPCLSFEREIYFFLSICMRTEVYVHIYITLILIPNAAGTVGFFIWLRYRNWFN